jgi:glutamine cyclotransferase
MRRYFLLLALPLSFSIAVAACGGDGAAPAASPSATGPEGRVELLESLPHADSAWTEGLLVSEGILWESTGLNGKSQVRGLDKETGDVLWSAPNPDGYFNEGLVRAFGKTYLLTYREEVAYLFDRNAAKPYTFLANYEGEGWGLTATGDSLVNSNGTATLFYRDPSTFEITKKVTIRYEGEAVDRLNELEYDGTYIWANQWQTPYVYRIREDDPSQVTRYTLPSDFCAEGTPNGIAWDQEQGVFYLTGQTCAGIWKVRFD